MPVSDDLPRIGASATRAPGSQAQPDTSTGVGSSLGWVALSKSLYARTRARARDGGDGYPPPRTRSSVEAWGAG